METSSQRGSVTIPQSGKLAIVDSCQVHQGIVQDNVRVGRGCTAALSRCLPLITDNRTPFASVLQALYGRSKSPPPVLGS